MPSDVLSSGVPLRKYASLPPDMPLSMTNGADIGGVKLRKHQSAHVSASAPSCSQPYVKSQAHLLNPTAENPLPTAVPPPIAAVAGTLGDRHVLCLIGLPERGKPFIAHRLMRYLSFFHGAEVRLFDLHEYSQRMGGAKGTDEAAELLFEELKDFMEDSSEEAAGNLRTASARGADETVEAEATLLVAQEPQAVDRRFKNVDSGKVAIIYSTESYAAFGEKWAGTSKERRRWALERLQQDKVLNAKMIFIEVIVTSEELLMQLMLAKQRAQQAAAPAPESERELQQRRVSINKKVLDYKRRYVTLQEDGSEDDLSYIKLINYGQQVVTNRMHGYLRMRIAQFLTVIHPTKHTIYLSRHGQSEYNVLGKLGGNPPLSKPGDEYSKRLGAWVPKNIWIQDGELVPCRLWTSSLQRTILTAAHIPHPLIPTSEFCPKSNPSSDYSAPGEAQQSWEQMAPRVYRNLDEIFAGEYEGMRYEEIKARAPDEASLRAMDKIGYRYPRGESYFDIIARLDPLVHEMESYKETLMVVSHQAVLRLLYAYLIGVPRASAPKIEVPLHTVIKITYDGWNPPTEERFCLGPSLEFGDGQKNL